MKLLLIQVAVKLFLKLRCNFKLRQTLLRAKLCSYYGESYNVFALCLLEAYYLLSDILIVVIKLVSKLCSSRTCGKYKVSTMTGLVSTNYNSTSLIIANFTGTRIQFNPIFNNHTSYVEIMICSNVELRVNVKFCMKVGIPATETYGMISVYCVLKL